MAPRGRRSTRSWRSINRQSNRARRTSQPSRDEPFSVPPRQIPSILHTEDPGIHRIISYESSISANIDQAFTVAELLKQNWGTDHYTNVIIHKVSVWSNASPAQNSQGGSYFPYLEVQFFVPGGPSGTKHTNISKSLNGRAAVAIVNSRNHLSPWVRTDTFMKIKSNTTSVVVKVSARFT